MSFILVPSQGSDIQINAWNWRPTILLLHDGGIIDDEQHERMGAQGAGGHASAELAERIAACLDLELTRMNLGSDCGPIFASHLRPNRAVSRRPWTICTQRPTSGS
jgi:hypothetical protein